MALYKYIVLLIIYNIGVAEQGSVSQLCDLCTCQGRQIQCHSFDEKLLNLIPSLDDGFLYDLDVSTATLYSSSIYSQLLRTVFRTVIFSKTATTDQVTASALLDRISSISNEQDSSTAGMKKVSTTMQIRHGKYTTDNGTLDVVENLEPMTSFSQDRGRMKTIFSPMLIKACFAILGALLLLVVEAMVMMGLIPKRRWL